MSELWEFAVGIASEFGTHLWSSAGIATVIGALLWFARSLFGNTPKWAAFEGAIIEAVRLAEKVIPDDAENKSVRRLNSALVRVIAEYRERTGKTATRKVAFDFREGIRIVHTELAATGELKS